MNPRSRFVIAFLLIVLITGSVSCNLLNQVKTPAVATPGEQQPTSSLPTSAITAPETGKTPTSGTQSGVTTGSELDPQKIYPPSFSIYPAVSVQVPEKSFPSYQLPLDLAKVKDLAALELTPAQQELLRKNGFAIAIPKPGEYREFYQVYESYRYVETQSLFVTTDAIFHTYHLVFDKMLRDLERDDFIPTLNTLTSTLLEASQNQLDQVKGTALEEPARRNVAFFAVASQLLALENPVPAEVKDLVDQELALIEAHQGAQISPIWDRPDLEPLKKLIEDYGQYIPRGHYTRSDALKQYFKAMMWYGRLTFRLRDEFETRRALLIVQALRQATTPEGEKVSALWASIYDPTVFIVGKSDDLSYHEYGAIVDQLYGEGADVSLFADDANLAKFIQSARQLPPPQINSMWVWIDEDQKEATSGFRVMGQRFTLDEYVFGQLIYRRVGDQNNPRMLPKGLDFFAAMGSQEALNILDEMGETKYTNYKSQLNKVQDEVSKLGIDSWTQNLYWSWLYAFQAVISPKDTRYPEFMRSQAWERKDLNTSLGSWTELKHDTILYAKQVMAEMGGGPSTEPPHGYVEPNPEAFARLLALAKMTSTGLDQRGLLSDTTRANLGNLTDLIAFLQDCAEKELAEQALDSKAYDRIRYIGGELEALTLASSDRDAQTYDFRDLSDQKAALVADVATGADPNGQLVALEEAIGQPALIYVVLPDQPYRAAVGAVFSYYEFTVPSSERMTDEQWQAQVEGGTQPAQPDWTKLIFAP